MQDNCEQLPRMRKSRSAPAPRAGVS